MRFLIVLSLVATLLFTYLWRRLVRDPQLPAAWRRAATIALFLLNASLPLTAVSWRYASRAGNPLLTAVAFGWLGCAFYVLGLLVVWDITRGTFSVIRWLGRALGFWRASPSAAGGDSTPMAEGGDSRPPAPTVILTPAAAGGSATTSAAASGYAPPVAVNGNPSFTRGAVAPTSFAADATVSSTVAAAVPKPIDASLDSNALVSVAQTRRTFVARVAAGTALAAASGIGVFGVRSALWEITTPEVPIGLRRLPRQLDGYTIALLTDVHIGPLLDGRFLRHLVEETNAFKPDLVAIGGDLVDGHVAQIGRHVQELRRLKARQGVCFVTGNHEYYSGAEPWIEFLEQLGVRVLMNERMRMGDAADGGAHFDLAGIPDHKAGDYGRLEADAFAATGGRDEERELVMLAHQPVQVQSTSRVGTGLQLSGHTHGGQLYPFGAMTLMLQPYLAGLHRHEPTDTQVYVSRGTGFWGPPMRVLAPAEIAIIRLHSV
jgi:predicted MPP superfamily phosphohydrolase